MVHCLTSLLVFLYASPNWGRAVRRLHRLWTRTSYNPTIQLELSHYLTKDTECRQWPLSGGQCYCPLSLWCMIKAQHLTQLWLCCHCSVLHKRSVILSFNHMGETETEGTLSGKWKDKRHPGRTFPCTELTGWLFIMHIAPTWSQGCIYDLMWPQISA